MLARLLIAALWLAATLPARAGFPFSFWASASAPASYTLLYNATDATAYGMPFGDVTNQHYLGIFKFNDATARTLGKVEFKLTKSAGSITGKTFTVKIWRVASAGVPGGGVPTDALYSLQATSNAWPGDDAWSGTLVPFTFSPAFSASAGVDYAITIDAGGIDASNYATGFFNSKGAFPSPPPGGRGYWRTDQSNYVNDASSYSVQMKIFTSP